LIVHGGSSTWPAINDALITTLIVHKIGCPIV
jgi:hypothetical protein